MIKKFFKFIYHYVVTSTIEDVKYINRVIKGELKPEEKQRVKDLKGVYSDKNLVKEMFKRYWMFLFLIVLAWVVGFMIGALYGEYQANIQLNEILYNMKYGPDFQSYQHLNLTFNNTLKIV